MLQVAYPELLDRSRPVASSRVFLLCLADGRRPRSVRSQIHSRLKICATTRPDKRSRAGKRDQSGPVRAVPQMSVSIRPSRPTFAHWRFLAHQTWPRSSRFARTAGPAEIRPTRLIRNEYNIAMKIIQSFFIISFLPVLTRWAYLARTPAPRVAADPFEGWLKTLHEYIEAGKVRL